MDFKLTITIDASTSLLGAINGLTEALTSKTQHGTIVETRTIKAPVEVKEQTATTQTQEVASQQEVKENIPEASAAPTAREYTVEEVRKIVAEKAKVNKEAAIGALHSLGATSISTLPKEKYPELMDLLNAF